MNHKYRVEAGPAMYLVILIQFAVDTVLILRKAASNINKPFAASTQPYCGV